MPRVATVDIIEKIKETGWIQCSLAEEYNYKYYFYISWYV